MRAARVVLAVALLAIATRARSLQSFAIDDPVESVESPTPEPPDAGSLSAPESADAVALPVVDDRGLAGSAVGDGVAAEAADAGTQTQVDAGVAEAVSAESPPPAPESSSAPFDLAINEELKAAAVIVVLRGDDVLVPVAILMQGGLTRVEGKHEKIDDVEYVSLQSLAPDVAYQMEESKFLLKLLVQPKLLATTVIDLRPNQRPFDVVPRNDPSAWLNYGLQAGNQLSPSLATELGVSLQGGILITSGVTVRWDGNVQRGLLTATKDDPEAMRRWFVGESIAAIPDALAGSAVIAGVGVARNYDLNPYFNRTPLPSFGGSTLTSSTMDVYVNGILTRHLTVPPGPYDLRNVPLTGGAGNTQIIVRDAFGRTQELAAPYYLSPGVLAQGISDYGATIGFIRTNPTTTNFQFGGPAALGFYRRGLTDAITLGGHAEGSLTRLSLGPAMSAAFLFGALDLTLAGSLSGKELGGAGLLAYTYSARFFSAGGTVELMSNAYANTSLDPAQDRALLSASIFAALPVRGVVSLGAEGRVQRWRDAGLGSDVSLNAQVRIHPQLTLTASAARQSAADQQVRYSGSLQLVWTPGGATTASLSYQGSNTSHVVAADLNRSVPVGVGYGYRLHASGGVGAPLLMSGAGLFQTAFGSYEATASLDPKASSASLSASGSVVFIGNHFFFARAVQRGYALVQVPGVSGVRGYVNNQEIGRTDGNGNLLVPDLAPYYANRLRIDDSDVPLTFSILSREATIATPFRGGALVRFEAVHTIRAQGTVVVVTPDGKRVPPSYGELSVTAGEKTISSPLGQSGEFYLEDLPAGTHHARITFSEGECQTDVRITPSDDPVEDLGELTCQ